MKTFGPQWHSLVYEMPLSILMLWARQDQYSMNDQVITLGDKEMIDEMDKAKRGLYGN